MTQIPQEPNQRGLRIPVNVNAPLTRCLTMQIPDDPTYIEHIMGVLAELGSGWLYQDDPDNYAQQVAQNWKNALNTIRTYDGTCGEGSMQLRACESGCGIEYSTDGLTWTCIDLSGCISDIVITGINDAVDNGYLARKGSQQGPRPASDPGSCQTFHVVLSGKERWQCPSPISAGDTVEVKNATGGWSDGTVKWFCPDGFRYVLGRCNDQGPDNQTGDPLGTAYHMQLVGNFNDNQWFNALNGLYIIPTNTPSTALFFQANDGSLVDNYGSIEFDVEVCIGTDSWCHRFDFTESDGGWHDRNYGGSTEAHYAPGVGWESVTQPNTTAGVVIERTFQQAMIRRIRCHGHTLGGLDFYGYQAIANQNGNLVAPIVMSNIFDQDWSGDPIAMTKLQIFWSKGAGFNMGEVGVIEWVEVYGNGPNPFGSSNC